MLTIIGAVSGTLGIIAFFIQIRDEHKITISKRTGVFLLVGIICVITGLVLTCENDQTFPEKSPASGTADFSQEILDNDSETSEPDIEDMTTPEPPPDNPEPDAPGTNYPSCVNESVGIGSSNDKQQIPDSNMSDTVQSTTPESPVLPPVTVDQVTLDYTSAELTVGEALSLLVTVSYSDGKTGYNTVWRSSNPVVASVDSWYLLREP